MYLYRVNFEGGFDSEVVSANNENDAEIKAIEQRDCKGLPQAEIESIRNLDFFD